MIPDRFRSGDTAIDVLDSIAKIAESILGIHGHGERVYLRGQDRFSFPTCIRNGDPVCRRMTFATADRDTLLYFPIGHPLVGRDRYVWVQKPNGLWWGWLVPEAKSEQEIHIVERRNGVYTPLVPGPPRRPQFVRRGPPV